jgi:hypothetical protein
MRSPHKQRRLVRAAALTLSGVLAFSLLYGLSLTKASAFVSLPQIETIKNGYSTYTILEIVPQIGSGSIGYYADGQEPTAGWRTAIASMTKAERQTYMTGLAADLRTRGLLGTGNSTPLEEGTSYSETLPWETAPSGAAAISLVDSAGKPRYETASVNCSFTAVGEGQGSFKPDYTPIFRSDGTGACVEKIDHFEYGQPAEGDSAAYYYYNPKFVEAVRDATHPASAYVGCALYTQFNGESIPTYQYAGTLGTGGFTMDVDTHYYYVDPGDLTAVGQPAAAFLAQDPQPDAVTGALPAAYPYRAVPDANTPFVAKAAGQTGYFDLSESSYLYVGAGSGSYAMAAGDTAKTIYYNTVSITGSYTNNNWLLRDVFDVSAVSSATMHIRVISATPAQAGADRLSTWISQADLIVLSAGLNRQTGGSLESQYAAGTNDLSAEQATAIQNALNAKRPVLVDGRTANAAGTQIGALAAALLSGAATGFVNGSLYGFFPDTTRTALATSAFAQAFSEDLATGAYAQVRSEITYENGLRVSAGQSGAELLPTSITMANCIRFIINYAGHRVENHKTSIQVLDVEPLTPLSSTEPTLKPATVLSWLPATSGLTAGAITVTTMSMGEFIGKIEDINETYDLVYIGASKDRFKLGDDGTTVYNDSTHMNGLLYSNIGDTYQSQLKLAGLLDRDYYSTSKLNSSTAKTYRLSGNDITAPKASELQNFAASGFPVVLADDLITAGQAGTPDRELRVTISGGVSSRDYNYYYYGYYYTYTAYTLSLEASLDLTGLTGVQYQWYRGNSPIEGATDSTYELTFYDTSSDYPTAYLGAAYTCRVKVGANAGEAVSNTLTLQRGLTISGDNTDADKQIFPLITTAISAGNGNNRTFTVSAPSVLGTVTGYQWYYYSDYFNRWRPLSGETAASYTTSEKGYFICRVRTAGGTYWSQGVHYYSAQGGRVCIAYSEKDNILTYDDSMRVNTSYNQFRANLTVSGFTMAARLEWVDAVSEVAPLRVTYQWYRTGNEPVGTNSASYTPAAAGDYTCTINAYYGTGYNDYVSVTSNPFTVASGWSVTSSGTKQPLTIPGTAPTSYSINQNRVDQCSVLYSTLSGILARTNVMSQSEAAEQKDTLLKNLNLSKPTINLTDKPADYSLSATGNLSTSLTASTLSYTFTITNPTDGTPTVTRYACQLYLDQNADGRYKSTEELGDLLVKEGGKLVDGNSLQASSATASHVYTVTRQLPSAKFGGIIPWKLEVVKVGAQRVHASRHGYTYVKPAAPTVINVLQVMDDSALNLNTDTTYKGLYGQIKTAYTVNVTAITIDQLNAFQANSASYNNAATLKAYLDGFNMLIMGFGDMYGSLTEPSANAVVAYINSGKAILFTHDTTSFTNISKSYSSTADGTVNPSWGYYFNTILRDPVGLDRYGVTNPTYGVTRYHKSGTTATSGLTAKAYDGLTDAQKTLLTSSGYSIAYLPKSDFATAGETQGFTKYELVRYSNNTSQIYPTSDADYATGGGLNGTNKVSQVNEGQITTFPFNINTSAFDSAGEIGSALDVAYTHDQYYQLNMNSNDIVVWYCLSGGNFTNARNDAVNSYYIYNRGNVTYSGAGHTTAAGTAAAYPEEAKLFVNTMIAAFRAGSENPTMDFRSADDQITTRQFLPVEYSGADNAAGSTLQGTQSVYFTVSDPNLAADKSVAVEFSYESADGTADPQLAPVVNGVAGAAPKVLKLTAAVYQVQSGAVVTGGLRSGVLYRIDLPSALVSSFASGSAASLKLYGKVITTIGTSQYVGFNTLELFKLGMLTLR